MIRAKVNMYIKRLMVQVQLLHLLWIGADSLYRNKRSSLVNISIFILVFLLIIHVIRFILYAKVYIVYSMGLGPILLMGLIVFLIVFLYLKG
jgi:hypothetical protein